MTGSGRQSKATGPMSIEMYDWNALLNAQSYVIMYIACLNVTGFCLSDLQTMYGNVFIARVTDIKLRLYQIVQVKE